LKQYFEKELQLCRNRLDEIREQLVQAESRLDLSEKSILQLKAKLKSRQAMSSTNPERIRMDYSPIAQGDSGVVDRIDEDEP
jgi:chromosome segregation ATPase